MADLAYGIILFAREVSFTEAKMDPRQLFADARHSAICVFCGDLPTTREHVASRILLDDPLPCDLPSVGSCFRCNNGFSRDEEYLACLIECIICGSVDPEKIRRSKIRASLLHSPALSAKLAACCTQAVSGRMIWQAEQDRVQKVVIKLARGHVAHQYSEPQLEEPDSVRIAPLEFLTRERIAAFESIPRTAAYPEVGSRAFLNLFVAGDKAFDAETGWSVLQEGRYRYAVASPGSPMVRIVLSEYLACELIW